MAEFSKNGCVYWGNMACMDMNEGINNVCDPDQKGVIPFLFNKNVL